MEAAVEHIRGGSLQKEAIKSYSLKVNIHTRSETMTHSLMITVMLATTEISPVSIEIIFQIIKIYKDS